MNLAHFDLNLLLVFDALMRERNVSRAAACMFVTQPAMSHALNRLRQLLDDPLLVRTSRGMEPTPRALALIDPVRRALHDIEAVMSATPRFDPASTLYRFVIGCSDYSEYLLIPPLMKQIRQVAPHINLFTKPPSIGTLAEDFEQGGFDAVIAVAATLNEPSHLRSQPLFDDRMVCVARKDHPKVGDTISLEQYVRMEHALVSPWGKETGIIDEWLSERGLERRVALIITHYLSAPFIVCETDLLLSLPSRIATQFVNLAPLKIVNIPKDFPAYHIHMVWHQLRDKDPPNVWLRHQVLLVTQSIFSRSYM